MPEPQSLVRIPGRGVAAQEKLQLLGERENAQPNTPEVRTAQRKHTARHTLRHSAGTKVGVGYSSGVANGVWKYTNDVFHAPPSTRASSNHARFPSLHQLRHSLAG